MGADQKRKEARKRKFEAPTTVEEQPAATEVIQRPVDFERQIQRKKRKIVGSVAQNAIRATGIDDENLIYQKRDGSRDEEDAGIQASKVTKGQRFIVFIGNLPFTATDDSIAKHFAKVHPQAIRHRTEKATGKSKGFAFLEFEAYDRMKTCLKVYHHSTFDDGESPTRRLNVELTVGGGGAKSKDRKAKLRLKNVKLTEERQQRAKEDEKQAKAEEVTRNAKRVKLMKEKLANVGREVDSQTAGLVEVNGNVHPSRRKRMHLT